MSSLHVASTLRAAFSANVHGLCLSLGSRWFMYRARHCFDVRFPLKHASEICSGSAEAGGQTARTGKKHRQTDRTVEPRTTRRAKKRQEENTREAARMRGRGHAPAWIQTAAAAACSRPQVRARSGAILRPSPSPSPVPAPAVSLSHTLTATHGGGESPVVRSLTAVASRSSSCWDHEPFVMDGLSTLVQRVRHWSPVLRIPVAFHMSSATRLGGMSATGGRKGKQKHDVGRGEDVKS